MALVVFPQLVRAEVAHRYLLLSEHLEMVKKQNILKGKAVKMERVERVGKAERVEKVEKAEMMETMDRVESVDKEV